MRDEPAAVERLRGGCDINRVVHGTHTRRRPRRGSGHATMSGGAQDPKMHGNLEQVRRRAACLSPAPASASHLTDRTLPCCSAKDDNRNEACGWRRKSFDFSVSSPTAWAQSRGRPVRLRAGAACSAGGHWSSSSSTQSGWARSSTGSVQQL
jgi:hypothetical protein